MVFKLGNDKSLYGVTLLAFVASFILSLANLYWGHPAEDAYINFTYVENIVKGYGIVYYAGGPVAEGFVDWLWVGILAFLRFVRFDVAIAAGLMNAVGAAVIVFVFFKLIVNRSRLDIPKCCLVGAAAGFVLFCDAALAGYYGFSSLFYAAFAVLLLHCYLEDRRESYLAIPVLALTISLIRIDGLIIGAPSVILAGLSLAKEDRRKYFIRCALCLLCYLFFFSLRWIYFGLPFPLPVYVKKSGPVLAGVEPLQIWFSGKRSWGLVAIFVCISCFEIIKKQRIPASVYRVFGGLLPGLILLITYSFYTQAQNIYFRYQSFFILLLVYAIIFLARKVQSLGCWLLVVAYLLYGSILGIKNLSAHSRNTSYFFQYAAFLGRQLPPQGLLAVTEAGAIAYWSHSRVEDMVGLNNPTTALKPPSLKYLESIDPDILLIEPNQTLDMSFDSYGDWPVIKIGGEVLGKTMSSMPGFGDIYAEGGLTSYGDRKIYAAKIAPPVMSRYLHDHSNRYEVVIIRDWKRKLHHIWAFKKSLHQQPLFLRVLKKILKDQRYISYAQMKNFVFS